MILTFITLRQITKKPQQGGSEESCYFNPVDQKL